MDTRLAGEAGLPRHCLGLPERQGGEYKIPVLMKKHFTYILNSISHQNTYVGITEDIDRRLKEHNSGKTKSTKAFAPYSILHYECFDSRFDARKREKFLKSDAGREWIKRKFFPEKD
jgi:putative endonuclease